MTLVQDELFEALQLCLRLEDEWDKESCYGGVFMQNIMSDLAPGHKSKYLKPEDTLYPCNAVDNTFKSQCYGMQTSYILANNGYNFEETFAACESIEPEFKSTCFISIGRDASGSTVSDPRQTENNCRKAKTDQQLSGCVTGAVKDFISYYHSDTQGKGFCALFSDAPVIMNDCFSTVSSYYSNFR